MNRSALRSRRSGITGSARAAVCAVALVLAASVAFAWGMAAHQVISYDATRLLPKEMSAFFDANMENFLLFANEPDVLAETDPAEGANHFIDLDAYSKPPFDDVPSEEAEFVAKFGWEALAKGRLPWAVRDRYRLLVEAFRRKDYEGILRYAGYLSHYAADTTMPLHATRNYKGQFSGNVIFNTAEADRHVHLRFEIGMIDANREDYEKRVAAAAAKTHKVVDPAAAALSTARESYKHIDALLAADRAILAPGGAVTPEYYAAMYKRVGDMAVERSARAVEEVASYIESAWIEAGSPPVAAEKVALKEPPLVCRQMSTPAPASSGSVVVPDAAMRGKPR